MFRNESVALLMAFTMSAMMGSSELVILWQSWSSFLGEKNFWLKALWNGSWTLLNRFQLVSTSTLVGVTRCDFLRSVWTCCSDLLRQPTHVTSSVWLRKSDLWRCVKLSNASDASNQFLFKSFSTRGKSRPAGIFLSNVNEEKIFTTITHRLFWFETCCEGSFWK